jgi:hypothetical protein
MVTINVSTVPLLGLCHFFSFLVLYTVGRTPFLGYQPATHTGQHKQNKRIDITLRVEFEPTTQVFERAKTVHDLDITAVVIGRAQLYVRLSP